MRTATRALLLAVLFLVAGFRMASAQTVLKEATFDPEGKANIANLAEVSVDQENKQIVLFFLTKSTGKVVKGEVLYFDWDFNFIKAENLEEDVDKVRTKYKIKLTLFNACPESREPLITVEPNLSGQVVFKKGYIDYYYNWNTGLCDNRFKVEEKVKPTGEDGEKVKLVNFWTKGDIMNFQRLVSTNKYSYNFNGSYTVTTTQGLTGRVRPLMDGENGDLCIMGMFSEKGMVKENIGKNYTIQKYSAASISKIKETKLDFPVAALPIFNKTLLNGNVGYVFHRQDRTLEYIEVDYNTEVKVRSTIAAPDDAVWVVNDIVEFGNDVYIQGLVGKYQINAKTVPGLAGYVSNLKSMLEVHVAKPTGYQIMKVSGDKIQWVTRTPMAQFKSTYVTIQNEKAGKPYSSGPLKFQGLHVAENGNIMVPAQKFPNVKTGFGDVVALVFDPQGKLIANYSTAKRDKNDYNQYSPTEHAFVNSPTGKGIYWTIFEVAGAKKRGETSRILYYPRTALIANDGRSVGSFLEAGDRKYFLDDNFPVNSLGDGTFFYFGSNKKGKELWFYKIKFD